jgi:two-component system chemotaxis response regulator CheY
VQIVWIVDDDDEMSHAVKLMLQLLDFTVTIFRDARSAARQLLSGDVRPELMVLDINMPEVSGIDLLEFLRLREDLRSIPVVMLSSETTDRQVDEALGLGADAFVFKPVTIEELECAIQRAFAAHRGGLHPR